MKKALLDSFAKKINGPKSRNFLNYFLSFILPVVICSWLSGKIAMSMTLDKEKSQEKEEERLLVSKIKHEMIL